MLMIMLVCFPVRFVPARQWIALARLPVYVMVLAAVGLSCSRQGPDPDAGKVASSSSPAPALEALTGGRTRLVWLQDAWERNDVFSDRGQLRLMGFDSRDGRGEREMLPGPAPYQKPLLTPCGNWVVFTDRLQETIRLVDWEGHAVLDLATGTALALWRDPENDDLWIYAGRDRTDERGNTFGKIIRLRLHLPASPGKKPEGAMTPKMEPVWEKTRTGRDNFQLSADGTIAAGMFPWPDCGIIRLQDNEWDRKGRGCWTSMAPDNTYRMWMLDGAHRNLTLIDTPTGRRWQVPLAQAPGIGGHEVYHPRWSAHPRIMVMTGPYKIRHGGNNIRGGGDSVELHVGRFSPDFETVEAWVQVTTNPHANFYPDIWIDPATFTLDPRQATRYKEAQDLSATVPQDDVETLEVRVRLVETAPIPSPEDILPYTRALVANTYAIESVIQGSLDAPRILIAHWAIREGERLPDVQRQPGESFTLRIQDYLARNDLEGERLAKDVEDMLLPLFVDVTDRP